MLIRLLDVLMILMTPSAMSQPLLVAQIINATQQGFLGSLQMRTGASLHLLIHYVMMVTLAQMILVIEMEMAMQPQDVSLHLMIQTVAVMTIFGTCCRVFIVHGLHSTLC